MKHASEQKGNLHNTIIDVSCVISCLPVHCGSLFCVNRRIIGLYLSLVLVIGKFVRLWTQGLTQRVMIDEMPCPDYVHNLLCQIYIARDRREFELEEELFAKLIFLFRSPEMLIDCSRPRRPWTKAVKTD